MSRPFAQWDARIDAAQDERARRELLGEIGVWRASRLTDIPAQRTAAWALSRIYQLLGEAEPAAHEARQLLALCRATPAATREEQHAAERHLAQLERRSRPRPPREPKPSAGRAGAAPAAPTGEDAADAAARAGRWAEARAALEGRKGVRTALFRVWTELEEALALDDDGARIAAVTDVAAGLRARVLREASQAQAAPAAAEEAADDTSALARLLGRPLPRRRDPLVQALERFVDEHPDQADAVAATALEHHVETAGLKATAPWLFAIVARALAGDAPRTRAALAELARRGAFAVTAYDEPAFGFLVDVWRQAAQGGAHLVALRRGVGKEEPRDRKMWTLRFAADGVERLVVAAPPSGVAYDDELAVRLARRIVELGNRVAVIAPGPGNAGFRAACGVLGVAVCDDGAAPADVVARALAAAPLRPDAPARKRKEPAAAPEAPAADAPAAPRGPSPLEQLAALFSAEEVTAPEAYAEPLKLLRRAYKAFHAVRDRLAELPPADADARFAAFLRAVHAAAPEHVQLAEGATLAIQTAAAAPDGEVAGLLKGGDALAERFGGPGVEGLLPVVRALRADGWEIARVLRGVTRRDQRQNPALEALGDRADGLWRVDVQRGDVRGEVWWLADLTVEAEAVIPQLLLAPAQREVVVQDAHAPGARWAELGLGDALAWVDGAVDGLLARLRAWTAAPASTEAAAPASAEAAADEAAG